MERGITQEQVAEYLGISRPTYTQYESGRRQPGKKNLLKLCELYQVSTDYLLSSDVAEKNTSVSKGYFRIPVLGNVPAGLPIEAVTDIIDWEELPNEMGKPEDFFALRINGNSMEPKFSKGDVVIVRKQDDADSGDIVIAMINGCDAACKKLKKYGKDGIALVSSNTAYPPMFFSNEEIASKSVRILGKVVELRAKF
jgi:repressor LexA